MTKAVILNAAPTPVVTARKGSLAFTRAEELAKPLLGQPIRRARLAPEHAGHVAFAEALYGDCSGARHTARGDGLGFATMGAGGGQAGADTIDV